MSEEEASGPLGSWICPKCGAANGSEIYRCIGCLEWRPAEPAWSAMPESARDSKPDLYWVWVLIALAIMVIAAFVFVVMRFLEGMSRI